MALYAFSDLHIQKPGDSTYQRLLTALQMHPQSGDTVAFLGDIFDVWVGESRFFDPLTLPFIEALRDLLIRGVAVLYVEGNHDFLLQGAFKRHRMFEFGLFGWHPNSVNIKQGDFQAHLAHGDRVDSKDWSYRLLRWGFRSLPFRFFVALAPGGLIRGIGQTMSRYSGGTVPTVKVSTKTKEAFHSYARQQFDQGSNVVILGHCHEADELQVQGKFYLNMGFPPADGLTIKWISNQPPERIPF